MSLSFALQRICLTASIICLGLAYILPGNWWILLGLTGIAAVWFYLRKKSAFWSNASVLFACVLLSAIGVTMALSLPLLVLGCTASLAFWDLASFAGSLPSGRIFVQRDPLERCHLQSLGAAVCTGLIFVLIGSSVDLQFSFAVTAFLVLVAVGGLTFGLQSLRKHQE